jgi:hypothetical protein
MGANEGKRVADIEVVAGTEMDQRIAGPIDAAVVLESYHEFTQYRAMLASILRALRSGGVLVLDDHDAAVVRCAPSGP